MTLNISFSASKKKLKRRFDSGHYRPSNGLNAGYGERCIVAEHARMWKALKMWDERISDIFAPATLVARAWEV